MATTTRNRPCKTKRIERQQLTRSNLLRAAAEQVELEGYAGASIQKITAAANVANGTFYNYFASQQDLFDTLLPEMGDYMLDRVRQSTAGESDGFARERLGFQAFFDYLDDYPSFYRVLNEAESFAPKAYQNHMRNMVDSYVRAMKRSKQKGRLKQYSLRELEVIAYILISARNYLSYGFCLEHGQVGRLPSWVTQAYMKFFTGGMTYGEEGDGGVAAMEESEQRSPSVEYLHQNSGPGWLQISIETAEEAIQAGEDDPVSADVITALINRTALDLAHMETDGPARLSSLSVNFGRATHIRRLIARATYTAVMEGVAHISIQVHEQDVKGEVIASGLLTAHISATAIG